MLAKIACFVGMHFPVRVGSFDQLVDMDMKHVDIFLSSPVYKCTACEKLFIKKEES